ncbi:amidohydrolase [Ammoniphilus sp. YIM 78166]|uniref:amidohydrolase n=1 Tax=Ammoniphilus sp. YIM 78166 TaxID=1644106 RepID=UPI00106F6102|nr:amidohydrolase [Ammoniphilus sp. YIM 78166]
MSKPKLLQFMENQQTEFTDMAQKIWENPQLAYEEEFACQLQMAKLKDEGFRIQTPVAGISTAFVAEYGSGKPIIGILGEYDALPGLSQTVDVVQNPIISQGPGHGCGHNLLGTAGVEAIIALKKVMDAENRAGTIRYYGCPAEEVLSGKSYMAQAGVFDDLDCALTWHPGTSNIPVNMSMQALVSIKFHFKGIPAHAGQSPHAGRSALDAVELMNVGANYLREHVLDGSRIHYVITNGGLAPNVVPEDASVWYFLRAATKKQVDEMLRRVQKIAEGAALMTETSVTSELLANIYQTLPNEALNDLMVENMEIAGPTPFSEEEQEFARKLVSTIQADEIEELLPITPRNDKSLYGKSMGGSSDVGDVSWITPLGQIMTTCAPKGVEFHTWQATSSFGSSIGFKGMHLAAKTMALTALDLLSNKDQVLDKAKQEFQRSTMGKPYVPGIGEFNQEIKV